MNSTCPPDLAAALATLPLPVAVVDLETTGGHFHNDRITEIAIWRFANGQAGRHEWLVQPQQPISRFITELTGISNEMVADAPVFAELAPELLPLLQGHILVAHNSRFDYSFLRHEFARAGHAFAAPTLCTVQLSRRLYPQYHKHNLDSIIERFAIATDTRHRAWADVAALLDFLRLGLREHGADAWLAQWPQLVRPAYPPVWLPEHLRHMLYRLPDTPGISVWRHPGHQQAAVMAHEQTFSQISALFNSPGAADRWRDTAQIDFTPAASLLHAHALAAEHSGSAAEDGPAAWHTVRFGDNGRGGLRAQVVPLYNGRHPQRPYGLFAHPKGAKRALAEWARQYGFCPAELNLPGCEKGCPVADSGQCAGDCDRHKTAAILKAATRLPVCDWGSAHEVMLHEHDALNGCRAALHCAAGAIELADGSWYFHEQLPRLFKQRFKQREGVEILA
ncbi:DNA polymerase-3 subunit epsilon [Neisseria sp. HSC-16F19]|nr:3'-5' exonuclease [Neisseria sp. HSC-16F19]MCP2041398.1 DNA polymerase-3 subunit epsilon [Neisseria sp. HSC-16F19]